MAGVPAGDSSARTESGAQDQQTIQYTRKSQDLIRINETRGLRTAAASPRWLPPCPKNHPQGPAGS